MSKRKAAKPRTARRKHRGFTLLEVMIAMLVFATLAAAVITAGQYSLKQNARLKEQLCGAWMADNHLSELQLGAEPATARVLLSRQFDRREWHIQQTVSPSVESGLLKVELSVSPADSERVVYRTSGWINALVD